MKSLTEATDAELEEELKRRQNLRTVPQPIHHLNELPGSFKTLQTVIIDSVAMASQEQRETRNFEYLVYVTAMEAVYGKAYWKWHRSRPWNQ